MTPTSESMAKRADLAGPGIGDYAQIEKILPRDYQSLLTPRETQRALFAAKNYIEENLCRELNLMMVAVPLIVDKRSGVNDYLDRDGSRTPIEFHIRNDGRNPIDAQVVQAATKWKRIALKRFDCQPGEGICTDMRAVRKDYFLDHDHSAYVDQWDWERAITAERRNLDYLKEVVRKIWKVLVGAERHLLVQFPALEAGPVSQPPRKHRILSRRGDPRHVSRLAAQAAGDGDPPGAPGHLHHRHRVDAGGRLPARVAGGRLRRLGDAGALFRGAPTHGLNGDILVWNPVTKRRHELSSMGIRVNAETLRQQLELTGQLDFLEYPYHRAIVDGELPLSIGGGIGQSRTLMLLLRKAHLGEVSVTVWPKILKEMCARNNIHVLE